MNKNLGAVIGFATGAIIASGATYIFTKKKYETLVNEEITSAREAYNKMAKDLADKNNNLKLLSQDISIKQESPYTTVRVDYANIPDISNGLSYEKNMEYNNEILAEPIENGVELDVVEEPHMNNTNKPYTIAPDNFGNEDSYALRTLHYYYEDKVLTDEEDNPDTMVGLKNLETFGEYDEYTVYVRNDNFMTDYEILLDERSYSLSHK